jgi:exodeoxyribonuclease V gamma subunit
MEPLDPASARDTLINLITCWRDGLDRPLPTACKTALAFLADGKPWEIYDGSYNFDGEIREPCLARLWEDFAALCAEPDWESCTRALYGPLADWLENRVTILPLEGASIESEAA